MELTDKEKLLMGKPVRFIQDLYYGKSVGIVSDGTTGTICDFGRTSGDPIVQLDNGFSVVVPWSSLEIV